MAYYSVDYPESRPCQWEPALAFCSAQLLGDPHRRVLVVNPEPTANHIEPVELRDARYVEVSPGTGFETAADAIADHVRGLAGSVGDAAPSAPRWLPEQAVRAPRFVGRLGDMWRVHSALQASAAGMTEAAVGLGVAVVRGLGGAGKSLLAQEYALRFGAAYPGGIFWLRAGSDRGAAAARDHFELEDRLNGQMRDLARGLLGPERAAILEGMDAGDVQTVLRNEVAAGGPCLWIVDDLPSGLSADELREWQGPAPAGTLITTRSAEYEGLPNVPIGQLAHHEALELLTMRARPQDAAEQAAAESIVDLLGHHALAIDVAGAALRYQSLGEFASGLTDVSEDELQFAAELREELPTGHDRSIAATLARSIDLLADKGLDLLRLASLIATAPIDTALIRAALSGCDGLDERSTRRLAQEAPDQACALSLVDRVADDSWQVHALVARTMRFKDPDAVRRSALRSAAVSALTDRLADAADARTHEALRYAVEHAQTLCETVGSEAEAALAGRLAQYHDARVEYHSAELLHRRRSEALRELLGEGHPDALAASQSLASTLTEQGRFDESRELCERTLAASRAALGDEHPATLIAMRELARVLRDHGAIQEARRLEEDTLAANQRVFGAEDLRTLTAMHGVAVARWADRDLASVRELDTRVVEGRRRVLGEDHPDTLDAMNSLAGTLHAQGDIAGALELQQRVVAGMQRVNGAEHYLTLGAVQNLASLLYEQDDLVGSRELQEQTLQVWRRLVGEEHRATLTAMGNLALTLETQGDLTGAQELRERVVAISERMFGADNPRT